MLVFVNAFLKLLNIPLPVAPLVTVGVAMVITPPFSQTGACVKLVKAAVLLKVCVCAVSKLQPLAACTFKLIVKVPLL